MNRTLIENIHWKILMIKKIVKNYETLKKNKKLIVPTFIITSLYKYSTFVIAYL